MGLVHSLKEMKWDPGSVLDLRRKKLKKCWAPGTSEDEVIRGFGSVLC